MVPRRDSNPFGNTRFRKANEEKKKMSDMNVVTEVAETCETFALSNQFSFVSSKPNIPDL